MVSYFLTLVGGRKKRKEILVPWEVTVIRGGACVQVPSLCFWGAWCPAGSSVPCSASVRRQDSISSLHPTRQNPQSQKGPHSRLSLCQNHRCSRIHSSFPSFICWLTHLLINMYVLSTTCKAFLGIQRWKKIYVFKGISVYWADTQIGNSTPIWLLSEHRGRIPYPWGGGRRLHLRLKDKRTFSNLRSKVWNSRHRGHRTRKHRAMAPGSLLLLLEDGRCSGCLHWVSAAGCQAAGNWASCLSRWQGWVVPVQLHFQKVAIILPLITLHASPGVIRLFTMTFLASASLDDLHVSFNNSLR